MLDADVLDVSAILFISKNRNFTFSTIDQLVIFCIYFLNSFVVIEYRLVLDYESYTVA